MAQQTWWLCPNEPRCRHGAILHDTDGPESPQMCCVDGCTCGQPGCSEQPDDMRLGADVTFPSYYDQAEMTRPGHVPSLITDRLGTWGSCSCGHATEPNVSGLPTGEMTRAMWQHVADVDAV